MFHRTLAAGAFLASSLLVVAAPAGAQDDPPERRDLPGTVLEAEQRDDGDTNAAPWVIGSGLAALGAIGVGGTLLQRRSARASGRVG